MRVLTLITFTIATLSSQFLMAAEQTHENAVSRAVPEAFTGMNYQKSAIASEAMVSAANPHAVDAGLAMLAQGGNAIDAAVAIQLVLTLVEPQSSGIGGGAFLLWYDAKTKQMTSFDGREKAPSAATPELFFENGKPVRWIDAVIGGRSVGVPGVLHMLHQVHEKKGQLEWHKLFQPAIKLAENGFRVSPRLAKLVAMHMNPGLARLSPAKEYFYPNGKAIKEGSLLVNKPYANTLKLIAKNGIKAFYNGIVAKQIVEAVNNAPVAPGLLALEDLENYQSIERQVECLDYTKRDSSFDICSMGPPSSGGITVLQILAMLEPFDFTGLNFFSAKTLHLYSQAARLAFADRDQYIADSDFVDVPTLAMLDKQYLTKRSALINEKRDMGKATAGIIGRKEYAANVSIAQPNTSHLSIVDKEGNAISMTTSIEMGFGSTVMVCGFLLNNQLTDFSLAPKVNGKLVANRVEANKRPRSSMTPVIVMKDDELFAVLGSPGGSRIINYVGYALLGLLEFEMDLDDVVNGPRFSNRNGYTTLEKDSILAQYKTQLEQMGHTIRLSELTSGIHAIIKTKDGWKGAADPRREGTAKGL
ncbi:gamma-glutamyltransferase [Psychrosphaera sp. B3R10]|uniref:gamma-glutamyltransferase n=1 Tax=unclassified Psychrosphaera TaxID=2641570 RepID=UPI001C08D7DE|nr:MULTISPECIES: gamma-glutamyltransferase [unclassified Psychrosphaera]MBU2882379.1 gamma-glutamyltransferase [Psychrosphaera sp. I2R16]MBU2989060.1 gamma-glutamyltransferase [Psychrosphaera sp. B3R10]